MSDEDLHFNDDEDLPEYASFYPSLLDHFETIVMDIDDKIVWATTDQGTANSERRHFIDREYLVSLEGGRGLLDSLTAPTPPCTALQGTRRENGDVVLGMLSSRLRVKCNFNSISIKRDKCCATHKGWVQFKLQNVLVVESMPVPIHISMKDLDAHMSNFYENGKTYSRLQPQLFADQYQRHPYWELGNSITVVGSVGAVGIEKSGQRMQQIEESKTGLATGIKKIACANCQQNNASLQLCGGCRRAYYCGKVCQCTHWAVHKKGCKSERSLLDH